LFYAFLPHNSYVFVVKVSPVFGSAADNALGLRITWNDTWAYEVFIKKYELKNSGEYILTYEVILYDHFGLDLPDIEKFYKYQLWGIGDGFQSWFVLQHLWNYPPFITKMSFVEKMKGNLFNDNSKK
jgi:hypothetical protein